jgi:hypothetical protein
MPAAILEDYSNLFGLGNNDFIKKIKIIYLYYNISFFFMYMLSTDSKIAIKYDFLDKSYVLLLIVLLIFFSIYLGSILFLEYNNIYELRSNRKLAFNYYVSHVYDKYKISFVTNTIIILTLLLSLNRRKKWLRFLLPNILVLLLDYAHGGRAISYRVIIVIFVVLVIKLNRVPIKETILMLFFLIAPSYLQRQTNQGFSMLMMLGEFFNTALTPLVVLEKGIHLPFLYLIGQIVLSPFPAFVRSNFPKMQISYINVITEEARMGYGLAGNLVSEALVYGNWIFTIINPIILVWIIFYINKRINHSRLFGFLFVMLLITFSQEITRTTFYLNILSFFYLIFVHFIYLIPELRKVIFLKNSNKV